MALAGIVFFASTGISVHKMYCYCKDELVASLFCITDDCHTESEQSGKEDCCGDGICETEDGSPIQHNCSDCKTEKVIFEADYLFTSTKFEISTPSFWVNSPLFRFWQPVQVFQIPAGYLQPNLHPSGRELLPWIQSFLC